MLYIRKDDEKQEYIISVFGNVDDLFSKDDIDFFKQNFIKMNRNFSNTQTTDIKISYITSSLIIGKTIKRIFRNLKSP
jgi:hypothetical protein